MSEDKDMRLDAIIDYEMDNLEAKAYKLLLIWLDKSRKMFPNYAHAKMKGGDPRKSLIFRYCYTLVRKTQGILEESEYPLYVRAQLEILKHITRGNEHAMIDPNCLVGEKAWVRWKFWKKKYDERTKVIEDKVPLPANQIKVAEALDRTREFLVQTFSGEVSLEKLQEAVVNKNFLRWVTLGKISPYYLALSPFVAKVLDVDKAVKNLDVYRQAITPEIRAYFAKTFSKEYENADNECLLSTLRPDV
jgi:hypothetical protein